jgi:hypothetical protein
MKDPEDDSSGSSFMKRTKNEHTCYLFIFEKVTGES